MVALINKDNDMKHSYKNGINKVSTPVYEANVAGIAWRLEEERIAKAEKRAAQKDVTLRKFSWELAA